MNSLDKDWFKVKYGRHVPKKNDIVVTLPKESYGICKTVRCPSVFTDLANGVCQRCWDSGKGGQKTYGFDKPRKSKATEQAKKKRKDNG
jgi:hypothetical protein